MVAYKRINTSLGTSPVRPKSNITGQGCHPHFKDVVDDSTQSVHMSMKPGRDGFAERQPRNKVSIRGGQRA